MITLFDIVIKCYHSKIQMFDCLIIYFQVWDFLLVKDDNRLITGSSDMDLRVWELTSIDQVNRH